MKTHLDIQIYGRVQGVFFRAETREEAEKLDIRGFAKNMPDGSVYIEAEGEKEDLKKFVKWCNKGPLTAKVEKVAVAKSSLRNFKNFEVN